MTIWRQRLEQRMTVIAARDSAVSHERWLCLRCSLRSGGRARR
jgi:hypothetical protein